MEKRWQPEKYEDKIYRSWERGGFFAPKIPHRHSGDSDERRRTPESRERKDSGRAPLARMTETPQKPYSILLPPPNANDPLHLGHAMYVVEDILCRWHRMLGEPTLFLPGTDHAGIETQFVFEKRLQKKGKSRFDYDRETLYQMIDEFVEENRGIAKNQLKKLGFSLDWTRELYTLEPRALKTVFETFQKLHEDGLIYRGGRIVNYCPSCGTAFSDLEVVHQERDDHLYYLDYGPVQIATTRPETIFADVAVAVNPKDKRYKKLFGQKAILPCLPAGTALVNKELPIIADEAVQTDFGTGALKITPAHDQTDFEIGQRHKLPSPSVVNTNGKLINVPDDYLGMSVEEAREAVLKDLKKAGKLLKTEPLRHAVGICYRCKSTIEPLLMPQWFVKIKPLADKAIEVVKKGEVKIVPKRFEKLYFEWMNNIRDWNISRQIVWGPRIPVWYCLDCNPKIVVTFTLPLPRHPERAKRVEGSPSVLRGSFPFDFAQGQDDEITFEKIKSGLQSLITPVDATYLLEEKEKCPKCGGNRILQETDTFDTWFSSGQWPLTTLGFPDSEDFKYFYPTSCLDTMWDILFFWVARMIMLCTYRADKPPFEVAHMHSRVIDVKRQKMSKSRGNVIEPLEMVEAYGADALRMALVYGMAPASDIALSEKKIEAMRNFTNKIWNASRYIWMILDRHSGERSDSRIKPIPGFWTSLPRRTPVSTRRRRGGRVKAGQNDRKTNKKNSDNFGIKIRMDSDEKILKALGKTTKTVNKQLKSYRFGQALEEIYQFFWHEFCDKYLETTKDRREEALPVLLEVLITSLKLLHPFAPFVTEAIYQEFRGKLPNHPLLEEPYLIVSPWPKS